MEVVEVSDVDAIALHPMTSLLDLDREVLLPAYFGLSAWRPLGKFCDKIPSGWYKKEPCSFVRRNRAYNWRRPTLTGPIVPLPSAQESFTSGFGMGPGGSSLLRPPENRTRIYRVMISDCQYCDKCHSLASV
jgi:hypothetical protein